MLLSNNTASTYYVGGSEYLLLPAGTLTISNDTYVGVDKVAYAIHQLDEQGVVEVTDTPDDYPRVIGNPTFTGYATEVKFQAPDSTPNIMKLGVVSVVASPEKPIPLFLTGPPLGFEEDYLFAIATGEPNYEILFLVSKNGGVVVSPTPGEVALSLESSSRDDTEVLMASSGLGELLVLGADGKFKLTQPGFGSIIDVANDGSVRLGREEGKVAFFDVEPIEKPEIPASPDAQDVVDVLVAYGLANQAEE